MPKKKLIKLIPIKQTRSKPIPKKKSSGEWSDYVYGPILEPVVYTTKGIKPKKESSKE